MEKNRRFNDATGWETNTEFSLHAFTNQHLYVSTRNAPWRKAASYTCIDQPKVPKSKPAVLAAPSKQQAI